MEALNYYNQALLLQRNRENKTGESITLSNIGSAYFALGDEQQALQYYQQALSYFQSMGDISNEATTLANIGSVYRSLENREKALDYYTQSLSLLHVTGDRLGEADTLNNIGVLYYSEDDMENALLYMNKALAIRLEIRANWEVVASYFWIGAILQKLGNLDAAAEAIETAITLATALNHPDLPQLQALLAQINAQRGE